MDIRENIRIAVFSIKTNMMRSLLTMLGIIIGVASVIAIITVGDGGRDYIVGMIEDMGSNAIQIVVNATKAESSHYLTEADVNAVRRLDNVKYCSPYEYSFGQVDTKDYSSFAFTIAGNEDVFRINEIATKYGRAWTKTEYEEGKFVCVLSTLTAKDAFGRENCVGETINYTVNEKTIPLKVIGIVDMADMMQLSEDQASSMDMTQMMGGVSMGMIGIPASLNAQLNNRVDQYSQIFFITEDGADLQNVGESALNVIKTRHGSFDDSIYTLSIMAMYIDLLDSVINIFTTFIAAVSAISLIVGGIGVMNIMLVSVTERTREIGIRMAIGATGWNIRLQFLVEAVTLSCMGGLVGIILGIVFSMLVSKYMSLPTHLSVWSVLLSAGFSAATGIFFGYYPAYKASKLTPIDALRYE